MSDLALKAIADPRRRAILRLVLETERASGEIAQAFDVTQPAISQHLAVLMEAGLVSVRKNGTRRLYRARKEGLMSLRDALAEFWDDRLLSLKEAAEAEERRLAAEERRDYGTDDRS